MVHLAGDAPEQAFDLGARLEVEQTEAEQVEGLFADLLGVVPDFQRGAFGELVPRLVEFLDEFVVVFLGLFVVVPFGQRGLLQHLEDEHGVVRRQGTTRLADDVGVGEFVLVAGVDDGVDGVVGVFLDAVVDRAGAAGTGAVVVDAEAAAHVDVFDMVAHLVELHIELCRLTQGHVDFLDFADLAADVVVDELEARAVRKR